jgi:transglutaminase/protease-like cytokinesis protein 3
MFRIFNIVISSFFLLTVNKNLAQVNINSFDYSKSDSIALNTKIESKKVDLCYLSNMLSKELPTQQEKTRAIFRWITSNIKYSTGVSSNANDVLHARKASCLGYANLFKEMCSCINIECRIVEGWVKTDVSEINKKIKLPNHAWNIVNISNSYYLFDPTYAASDYILGKKKMAYSFDSIYFAIDPEFFIFTHYPENKKDQLLEKEMDIKYFRKLPIIFKEFYFLQITTFSPTQGLIKCKAKRPISFEFISLYDIDLSKIGVLLDDKFNINVMTLTHSDNKYSMSIKISKKGEHILAFYYNEFCFISYKLLVK